MPVIKQYKCDGCGAEKREANHWWAVSTAGGMLRLEHLAPIQYDDTWKILCGQGCVTKTVSEFMGAKRREVA